MNDWLPILKIAMPFLVLFGLAEGLYHFGKVSAEVTRKVVHIGTGLLTLLFPFTFNYLWQVIVICGVFLIILICSKRYHFFPSINAVQRSTLGSILFPIVVIILFGIYKSVRGMYTSLEESLFFWLPLLIMALADPAAAFAGNLYKKKKRLAEGKTIAGSVAFFITALIISTVLLYNFTPKPPIKVLLWAILLALVTTIAERLSSKGWDNFTIPLTAAGLLYLIE